MREQDEHTTHAPIFSRSHLTLPRPSGQVDDSANEEADPQARRGPRGIPAERHAAARACRRVGYPFSIPAIRARGLRRQRDGFFLRAESYFNVATHIEELDKVERGEAVGPSIIRSFGGVSLHEQSHGESFLALLRDFLNSRERYFKHLFGDKPE
jgi:hypothetical protein